MSYDKILYFIAQDKMIFVDRKVEIFSLYFIEKIIRVGLNASESLMLPISTHNICFLERNISTVDALKF